MKQIRISVSARIVALSIAGFVLIPLEGVAVQAGTNDAQEKAASQKRDPFWPTGYMPSQSIPKVTGGTYKANTVDSWSEAMKKVVINGVSSRTDREYFAVINGDVKRVGDTVSVRLGTSIYTWAVDGIESPGSVKLRRLSVRQG